MRQTTAETLRALHGALGALVEATQFALMDRDLVAARERLAELAAALARHVAAEDAHLLPAYARWVEAPGRGAAVEVFVAEHQKILRLLADLAARLDAGGTERVPHAQALALLEAMHPLKGLLQHHEDREERLLAPALDEAAPETAAAVRDALWREAR